MWPRLMSLRIHRLTTPSTPALPALVAVTAVWGLTFVQVKDAVELYPVMPFLALRFAIAALVLAPFAVGQARGARPARSHVGRACRRAARRRATRSRPLGLERTSVSSAGLRHRHVRGADPAHRVRVLPHEDRTRDAGSASCSPRSASRCSPGVHEGQLGGNLLVLGGRGGLLAADRADGAVRAAATTCSGSPCSR